MVACLVIVLIRRVQAFEHLHQSFDFFLSLMAISFGPYLVALGIQLRTNESGTIWKKSWPVGIIIGISLMVLGVMGLVRMFK